MKTKKTCLILLLLFIGGGGISAQIMVEYTLQRLLIYHPKDGKDKQHLLLEKLPPGTSEEQSFQQNSFQKAKNAYVKAYSNYKKIPKIVSHDTIVQQNFLYNIDVIYGIFTKKELFARMHPNDVQSEAIYSSLNVLLVLMKDGATKQTPELFEEVNTAFEALDDSFYQLLIE